VQAKQYEQAIALLTPIKDLVCPKRLRDQRDLLIAQSLLELGQPWQSFLELREFSVLYPHSDLRSQSVDIIWNAGKTLTDSDGGFLFLWSDKQAGRTVLEHLVTRYPDTDRLADALRLLGDMAFENANYELAQERYRDIIHSRPDSDWRFYAQFRFAMSIVAGLRGPDYDLYRMELAVGELRAFLGTNPESPKMLAETTAALEKVLLWQMQRHLSIAEFYRTLNSRKGERYHLELATRKDFANVPGYPKAVEMLQTFEASQAKADEPPATPVGGLQ
jgi:tetratricopeptide (TPR) repeat protein